MSKSEWSANAEMKAGLQNTNVERVAAIRERVEADRKARRMKIALITSIPVITIAAAIIYGVLS